MDDQEWQNPLPNQKRSKLIQKDYNDKRIIRTYSFQTKYSVESSRTVKR